jgi:hypothetical protein
LKNMLQSTDTGGAFLGRGFQKIQKLVVFPEKLLKRKHNPGLPTLSVRKVDEKMLRERDAGAT